MRKLRLAPLLLLLALAGMQKALANPQHCVLLGSKPSLIVKFYDQLSQNSLKQMAFSGIQFTHSRVMSGGAYLVYFTPPKSKTARALLKEVRPGCYSQESLDNFITEIKKQGSIEEASPNIIMNFSAEPAAENLGPLSIPRLKTISSKQWDLLAPPGGIDAQNAWTNYTTGSPNATIAVLDTGIFNNASLNPNLLLPGVYFIDGGYYGVGATPTCPTCPGSYHGTHVAGIVATSGILAYGETIYGVAPTSTVIPINVFSEIDDPTICDPSPIPCIRSYTADQVNALNWLAGENFTGLPSPPTTTVGLNMSLGGEGSCPAAEQTAFNSVLALGLTAVIAAGNDNHDASQNTPANCQGMLTVASTGLSGERAYYSNWGSTVTLAAPGGDKQNGGIPGEIYSTLENSYGYLQGTSMAAPHVAGLVALLYSINPTLNSTQTIGILTNPNSLTAFPPQSSVPAGTSSCLNPSAPEQTCGAGIIDAFKAAGQTPVADIIFNPTITITNITNNSAKVSWSAASWSNAASTGFLYSIYFNNGTLTNCSNILDTTSCTVTGLAANTLYSIYVSATDQRGILTAVNSMNAFFTTTPSPPSLTIAARNPFNKTIAYLYYNSLGSSGAGVSYEIFGTPAGTTFSLDAANKRFIVGNILTPKAIANVYIKATYQGRFLDSNAITIPSILN